MTTALLTDEDRTIEEIRLIEEVIPSLTEAAIDSDEVPSHVKATLLEAMLGMVLMLPFVEAARNVSEEELEAARDVVDHLRAVLREYGIEVDA